MFGALKAIGRLRVNPKAEMDGNFIDNYEHGQSTWPDVLPLPEIDAATGIPVRSTAPAAGELSTDNLTVKSTHERGNHIPRFIC